MAKLLRQGIAQVVVIALACFLAGCAGIPTMGPVEEISQPPVVNGAPPVDIEPAQPMPGGNPDSILAGFLTAVASGNAGRFVVARQYLTPQAAENWDPTQGVTVYSSDNPAPIGLDKSAVLRTPVIGRIDADGHYTAVSDPSFSHNFNMTKDADGEWRIDDPGTGIFISQYRFEQSYRAVPVYFFNKAFNRLVIENLYMNWGDATPAAAVEGLLRGPSAWLSSTALSVIPPQTRLIGGIPVQNGVAQVSLTQQAAGLSDTQQVQMAAQLLRVLESFSYIKGVVIDVDSLPLTIRGADAQGVVRDSTIDAYQTIVASSSQDVLGLRDDGSVVRLSSLVGAYPQPILGPLGRADWGDVPTQLAVGSDGTTLAMTSDTGLWVGSASSGQPANEAIEATGLTRPQVDDNGVWVVANGDVPTLYQVALNGVQASAALTELAGAQVVAFRVAPDQSRIAVVAHFNDQDMLGLLRISSISPLTVDGWRPLVVNTGRGDLATCLDVGWVSPTQMIVLASASNDENVVAYRLDVDAALVESIGPIGGDAPVALSVQPHSEGTIALVVTTSGAVLRYEDRTRWTSLVSGLVVVAQAG
ncbi:MAG: LpqB family beta-propeller domain-containing protein [Propionibacteriaceae bacterium]|nr:LpqB family beta-propeller domain-containing protein [Propionibacteriaceae bacterium]